MQSRIQGIFKWIGMGVFDGARMLDQWVRNVCSHMTYHIIRDLVHTKCTIFFSLFERVEEIVDLETGEGASKRFRGMTDDEIRRSFKLVLGNGDQIPVIAPSDEVMDDWIKGVGFVLQSHTQQ
jgi:hypothetical protein